MGKYLRIVRKYLIHGIPYGFKDNPTHYYDFREQIANHWHVGFQEVLILGSGKLGYSYHKNSVFSDESDIDVAIVNQNLFECFYQEIRNFQYRMESGLEVLTSHEKNTYTNGILVKHISAKNVAEQYGDVLNNLPHGIYVVKEGSKTRKIIL